MVYDTERTTDGKIAVYINGEFATVCDTPRDVHAYLDAGAPGARIWTPQLWLFFGMMAVIICGTLAATTL